MANQLAKVALGDVDLDADAGQRFLLQAAAVGAPAVAFEVRLGGDDAPADYERFGIPYADRNAQRLFVAPWTGTYVVRVGELSNFRGIGGEPTGSADFTYLFGVERLDPVEPVAVAAGAESVVGDLLDVPGFVVSAAEADGVAVRLETGDSVRATWFTSGLDYADPAPAARFVALPEGGLLLRVDHVEAAAADTDFTLHTTPALLTGDGEPNQIAEDATALGTTGAAILVGLGGFAVVDEQAEGTTEDFWSFTVAAAGTFTVETDFRTLPADTTLALYAAENLEEAIGFNDDADGLYSSVSAELAEGGYVVVVRSFDDEVDGDYFLSVAAE